MATAEHQLTTAGSQLRLVSDQIPDRFANDLEQNDQPDICRLCLGSGWKDRKTEYRGREINEVEKCDCVKRRIAEQRFTMIPAEYRDSVLSTLEPRADLHPKQAEYIELMRANPLGKFVLSGDFGTGKTHFFWALYREAVSAHRRVWAGTLQALISEFQQAIQASQREEVYILPLTAEDLRQTKEPYSLFLDDIDKARATEYTAEQLFALVDACYSYGHQLVVTTNLTVEGLVEYYRRADKDFGRFGGSIVRRLLDNAHEIEMF